MYKYYFLILCSLGSASSSYALDIWKYLKQYQVGIDYAQATDAIALEYQVDTSVPSGEANCSLQDSGERVCSVGMVAGHSSGFGIFLQQAFKRQGTLYFDADLGFSLRYLEGAMAESTGLSHARGGHPLTEASFQLLALVVKPYIQVGITPKSSLPDILITIGPAFQTTMGQVSINDDARATALISASGLMGSYDPEIVLARFGDGAFSLFAGSDSSGGRSTPFYPEDKDGMSDFKASFHRGVGGSAFGYGLKLVLDWP